MPQNANYHLMELLASLSYRNDAREIMIQTFPLRL